MDSENAIGVKRAAARKLVQELNITLPVTAFEYLTRIHYLAPSEDTPWGEPEIDYILIAKVDDVDITKPNPEEVAEAKWASKQELEHMIEEAKAGKLKLTPWFFLITSTLLFSWWDNLQSLDKVADTATIHRLGFEKKN